MKKLREMARSYSEGEISLRALRRNRRALIKKILSGEEALLEDNIHISTKRDPRSNTIINSKD